jgi:aspartate kinase
MKILKFGGTSVKDAVAMQRVFDIISTDETTKLIVLSACSGITDKLIILLNYATHSNEKEMLNTYNFIQEHHLNLLKDLVPSSNPVFNQSFVEINQILDDLFKFINGIYFLKEATNKSLDKVLSYGEILSTKIFHFYLLSKAFDSIWFDARNIIKTNSEFNNATIDFEATKQNIPEIFQNGLFNGHPVAITQGFIASDLKNNTTTLGRGGSDFSAAIFGKLLSAEVVEIWTDVDGILTADPRQVELTRTIPVMEFDEVRALSYFGAKVLHPQTLLPAMEASIPVKVLNSLNKHNLGTSIVNSISSETPLLHSVLNINAQKISFSLAKFESFNEKAIDILNIFEKSNTQIYSISIAPDSLIIWIGNSCNILKDIDKLFCNYFFELDLTLELIALTGINLDKYDLSHLLPILAKFHLNIVGNTSANTILLSVRKEHSKDALMLLNDFIINQFN